MELFTKNIIQERTWNDIFLPQVAEDSSGGMTAVDATPAASGADIISGGRYVGSIFESCIFKSKNTGARIEVFPDDNTGMIAYDDSATPAEVFKILVAGTNVGDVVLGNYAGGAGAMWDKSAGTFTVKGAISASSLDIPDTVTANSFHVDSDGNAWWGATTLVGSTAYVTKAGVAHFSSISLDTDVVLSGLQAGSSLAIQYLTAGSITSKAITLAISAGTGDSYIAAGKTDYDNSVAGFILGIDDSDSDLAKFYIGDSTHYLNWTGAAFNIYGATVTAGTIQTATSGTRIVMTADTLITYSASNATIFQLNVGTTEVLNIYSDGTKRAITLFENTSATADILYIEMGAGSGRGIYINNIGESTTEAMRLYTSSGIGIYVQNDSDTGVPIIKAYQLDLDKTGIFLGNGVSYNQNDKGLLELNCSATSSALKAVLHILSNSTSDQAHIRFSGGPSPGSPEDGDLWYDGSELYLRIGGTTYKFNKTAI